jgi:class 3 adenylate cyclase
MQSTFTGSDVRDLLPMVKTPTLLLHRTENRFVRVDHARYLAEHIAGAKLVELPGADHVPFVGDMEALLAEVEQFLTGTTGGPTAERVLATVLFSDIVDSTSQAAAMGDRRWREVLDDHDRAIARQVQRFDGTRVKKTGDGVLATFEGPTQAIRCGVAMRDAARQLGLEIRVGVHTGEIEKRDDDDIGGIAVNIASRVQAEAAPGTVLVSRVVTDLVAGSGLTFSPMGDHELKGVPGSWALYTTEL